MKSAGRKKKRKGRPKRRAIKVVKRADESLEPLSEECRSRRLRCALDRNCRQKEVDQIALSDFSL